MGTTGLNRNDCCGYCLFAAEMLKAFNMLMVIGTVQMRKYACFPSSLEQRALSLQSFLGEHNHSPAHPSAEVAYLPLPSKCDHF